MAGKTPGRQGCRSHTKAVTKSSLLLHKSVSGNFRSATDDDPHSNTGMAEHGDERIDTEAVDLASDKVADSWLGHVKH